MDSMFLPFLLTAAANASTLIVNNIFIGQRRRYSTWGVIPVSVFLYICVMQINNLGYVLVGSLVEMIGIVAILFISQKGFIFRNVVIIIMSYLFHNACMAFVYACLNWDITRVTTMGYKYFPSKGEALHFLLVSYVVSLAAIYFVRIIRDQLSIPNHPIYVYLCCIYAVIGNIATVFWQTISASGMLKGNIAVSMLMAIDLFVAFLLNMFYTFHIDMEVLEENRVLDQMLREIESVDITKQKSGGTSGNQVLDLILRREKRYAKKNQVTFNVATDSISLSGSQEIAVGSITQNLTDNMITWCIDLGGFVDFSIREKDGMLILRAEASGNVQRPKRMQAFRIKHSMNTLRFYVQSMHGTFTKDYRGDDLMVMVCLNKKEVASISTYMQNQF